MKENIHAESPGKFQNLMMHLTYQTTRDVISVSKLVKKDDGPEEIVEIINTLAKYGE